MTRRIIDLDAPDRFEAGAVGEAGSGGFFLEAVRGPRVIAVALERAQLALLADRVLAISDELERRGLVAIEVDPVRPTDTMVRAAAPREEFAAGTLTVAWDDDGDRIIIEAQSMLFDAGVGESVSRRHHDPTLDEVPDDDPLGPDVLRVRLAPHMAQRFARSAARLVMVGQETCPLCGGRLGPGRHVCPSDGAPRDPG